MATVDELITAMLTLARAGEHLQGQHDQQDHAGGRGRGGIHPSSKDDGTNQGKTSSKKAPTDPIERKRLADSYADEFEFDKSKVIVSSESPPQYTIAGNSFGAAATYNPKTGEVTLYDGSFNGTEEDVRHIMAHETTHHDFQKFNEQRRAEERDIIQIEKDTGQTIMSPSGAIKDPYWQEVYPVAHAYHETFYKNYEEIIKKDGVTAYSKMWWKAYQNKEVGIDWAVNETIAEIASMKSQGQRAGIPTTWRQFYNAIKTEAKRRRKRS